MVQTNNYTAVLHILGRHEGPQKNKIWGISETGLSISHLTPSNGSDILKNQTNEKKMWLKEHGTDIWLKFHKAPAKQHH